MFRLGAIFVLYTLLSYTFAVLVIYYPGLGNNIYGFIDSYSDQVFGNFYSYLIMVASFFLGWTIALFVNRSKKIASNGLRPVELNIGFPIYAAMMLVGMLFVAMYMLLGVSIFSREVYHPNVDYGVALPLIKFLSVLSIVLISLSNKINLPSKIILLTIVMLLVMNLASRFVVVLAILLYVVYILMRRKKSLLISFLLVMNVFFMSIFTYYARGMEAHGIVNYLLYFDVGKFFENVVDVIYYFVTYSTFVTLATLDVYKPVAYDYLVMLNPLPGVFAGWYEISENMRVTHVVPFNSIGIIFAAGYLFTGLFYFLLGVAIGGVDRYVKTARHRGETFRAIFVWSLGLLFIVFHSQYTLRTSSRYLYYILFAVLLFKVFDLLKSNHRRRFVEKY